MTSINELIGDLIEELAGKESVSLINRMWNKENISEFKLADRLKLTVNQVRNMLYKLHSRGVVSFTRKKDKKKGWYIYYWTFDLKKALDLLKLLNQNKIHGLEEKMARRQTEDYFACPGKCVVFKYPSAMENEFKCPECGNVLQRMDTKKEVMQIKKDINKLRENLGEVDIYLAKEILRLEKRKARIEKRPKKKIKRRKKIKKKRKKTKKRKR